MTSQAPAARFAADHIRIGSGLADDLVARACHRARVVLHPAAAAARLTGDVVIIEASAVDEAALLLIAEIRRNSVARILLVALAPTVEQRILAFTHGADHVLDAQTDPRELTAILRNAVRPHPLALAPPRVGEEKHRWQVEADRWVLIAPNGREIRLTHSEHAVLALLIGNAGIVQPRDTLRAVVDGDASRTRVLDVLISRLRRKVWDIVGIELPLRSARSAGYVFAGTSDGARAASAAAAAATNGISE